MQTFKDRFCPVAAMASKFTWFHTLTGDSLHFLPEADDEGKWWEEATEGPKKGRAACGISTEFVPPGWFSRMGNRRCSHCCKKVGLPKGEGTPFNDKKLTAKYLSQK